MSLLSIVQNVANTVGVDEPSSVFGSTNNTSIQMLAIANRSGKMLARRHPWQRLQKEHTFSTVASTETYSLPSDYDRHIDNTAWDRTNYRLMRGSLSPQEWQQRKSGIVSTGINYRFRVRGNLFYLDPIPSSVDSMVFDYISDQWTTDSGGANPSNEWNADTDLTIFPEYLLELDLLWRFKKEKGLEYAEDFRDFETQFEIEKAADTPNYTIDMGYKPRIIPANVPEAGFG